ncbi:MAG TPA: GNAT family N-acetyltransferase [Bacteroidales bacterium]|nr:GNAT family N-acetyltransferase [Bacteroidales bacterium]
MSISTKEVNTLCELKDFVRFPDTLYKNNHNYVPPIHRNQIITLSKDKNPAFEHCEARYWLAFKNGEIAGRIAAILNHRYNEERNTRLMRFGWLDFVQDQSVLEALLKNVEDWAREKGMEQLHGPLGFSSFDASGVLVEGFEELPTSFGRYNFPYYDTMLKEAGFEKDVDWVEYNIKVPSGLPDKLIKAAELIKTRYQVRHADLKSNKDLQKYADRFFSLLNESYSDLYAFSTLTAAQKKKLADVYLKKVHPDYMAIVLNNAGEMVALGLVIPSLAKALQKIRGRLFPFGFIRLLWALRFNDTVDMLLIAVRPDYQNKGMHALIFEKIFATFKRRGIKQVETTRELENNQKVQQLWAGYETRLHKRARCYIKTL